MILIENEFLREIKDKGEKIVERDFVYYIFSNTQEILRDLTLNNYLLHGSSRKIIGKLMPHQANDQSKEFGNQKAIYLTCDPIGAMFSSLTGGVENIGKTMSQKKTSKHKDGRLKYSETYFAVSNPEQIKHSGYVYIFPKEVADANEHNEYVVKKPIDPELIIKINREYFPFKIEKICD